MNEAAQAIVSQPTGLNDAQQYDDGGGYDGGGYDGGEQTIAQANGLNASGPTGGMPLDPNILDQHIPTWRDALNEQYRQNPEFEKFKSLDDLAKSYLSAQSMIGKNKIVVPGENAGEEEWSDFFSALGRPEDVTQYEPYALPEGLDDALEMDPVFLEEMTVAMHEAGLTVPQHKAIMEAYNRLLADKVARDNDEYSRTVTNGDYELRKEWGLSYDQNMTAAARTVGMLDPDGSIQQLLIETNLVEHPGIIRMFHTLSKTLMEDSTMGGENSTFGLPISPQDAKMELGRLQGDPEFMAALMNNRHPGHLSALEKKSSLVRFMVPEAVQ